MSLSSSRPEFVRRPTELDAPIWSTAAGSDEGLQDRDNFVVATDGVETALAAEFNYLPLELDVATSFEGLRGLRLAANPTFRALSPEIQAKVLDLLAKVANDPEDTQTIRRLVQLNAFGSLSPDDQRSLLDGLGNTKEARQGLRNVLASPIFAGGNLPLGLSHPLQTRALQAAAAAIAPVVTGLGPDIDDIVNKSPTLARHIRQALREGWTISFGPAGGGSDNDPRIPAIVIDGSLRHPPARAAQMLAHEIGHAHTPSAPDIPPSGLTREEYIAKNVEQKLRWEAEACFENLVARQEILDNGGPDIGIAGSGAGTYRCIFETYRNDRDREAAIAQIAAYWGAIEFTSKPAAQSYRDFYAGPFADWWDKHMSHVPPGGRAE